jgi:DNA-binding transcriptional LysR family regulator
MNYTLHQLKVFVTVCETESITKASEELFLTQPAISIQLKKFQNQFDIALTELVGRRIVITAFGREIEIVCREIINKSAEIETTFMRYKGLLAGKLSISVVSTGKYVIPYFLSAFSKEHDQIDISIDVTNRTRVLQSLLNNDTEFALVSVVPDDDNIQAEELLNNDLFLVGGPDFDQSKVSKKDLHGLPFINREKGSATRNEMEKYLKVMGVNAPPKFELASNEAVKQAVCAGLGFSVLPLIGMRDELQLGQLKLIEAPRLPISTKWSLIYLKNRRLSPVGEAFVKEVRIHKSEIKASYFSEMVP